MEDIKIDHEKFAEWCKKHNTKDNEDLINELLLITDMSEVKILQYQFINCESFKGDIKAWQI